MVKQLKDYKKLEKNIFLAELIGIVLGDGNLIRFKRTEALRITCNSNNENYVVYVCALINKVFGKEPRYSKRKNENTIDIRLYQKYIISRLELPSGNKIENNVGVPSWVYKKKKYIVKCLKGLFETDGHFRRNLDNYLHVIELRNCCGQILKDADSMLKIMGFNPQLGKNYVRLARKKEVYEFLETINFKNNYCPVV